MTQQQAQQQVVETLPEVEGGISDEALAAARALVQVDSDKADLDPQDIARRAMEIAAGICIYTNDNIIVETMEVKAS